MNRASNIFGHILPLGLLLFIWLHDAAARASVIISRQAPPAHVTFPPPPATSAPDCVTPPAGLVGWWKGDGNTLDTIGANNGVNQNITYANGVVGQAFACDPENYSYGTYTGIQIPDQPAYILTNSLTIEGWVRPRGDGYIIFFRGDHRPGLDPYFLSMNGNSNLDFYITDPAGNYVHVETTLPYFAWTHVAATLDDGSGAMSIYTNGVLAAQTVTDSRPYGELLADQSPGVGIGNLNDGGNNFPFLGDIDEIGLYNRALSVGEIQAIYHAGSAGKCVPPPPAVPAISSISSVTATNGADITIAGTNFSPIAAANIVYFGAMRATVWTASATNLQVTVPMGATFAPVTVTTGGLTTYSPQPFLPTFAGTGAGISTDSFGPRQNLVSGNGPIQVVIADLDNDGKPDLIVANDYNNTISLYRNIGTDHSLTAAAFAPPAELTTPTGSYSPYGIAAADVDGDGKLDIIATDYIDQNVVSVYRNTCSPGDISAGAFATRVDFATGPQPQGVAVGDVDGDGRPDLLVANTGDGTVSILRNTSVVGSLTANSFAPKADFPTGNGCANVTVGDLDGDGVPDVATANSSGTVSLLRNISAPGHFAFDSKVDFATPDGTIHVKLVDLDLDGKLDVTVENYLPQTMSVFRNTSAAGSLTADSLAPRIDFALGGRGHTTAVGDLDGDGKPDLAVATELDSLISIFQNTGTPGSFTDSSLAGRVDFSTGWNAWGVAVGDLDGDGRPDVVFANSYDNNISIYQNQVPFAGPPIITHQPARQSVIQGATASLSVSADGVQPFGYQWKFNGTILTGATNATLTNLHPNQTGNYAVTVSSPYGNTTSSNATVSVIAQTILVYKYFGAEKITSAGQSVSNSYSGEFLFIPATANGTFVGWSNIKGKKSYWVNPLSGYQLFSIAGAGGQTFTVLGQAGQETDGNGQPHLWSDLHKGQNTQLTIGKKQYFSFPNTFTDAATHIYPNPQTGAMVLDEATSTYSFLQKDTQAANANGQTVADLVGALTQSLITQGYQSQ